MSVSEPSRYVRLFQRRGYVRVFSAGLGSTLGSAISSICLIWLVYSETGSALDIGLLGASLLVASISFSVFGGTFVDRYDRRRLMILSDLARALAMALVVVVFELDGFSLPTILAASFVVGAFSSVFNPAEQAIIPALVETELVADANGWVRSSRSAVSFAGAAVGGVLIVTVGPVAGVAVNALTFALSAALLFGLDVAARGRPNSSPAVSYLSDVRAGFRWLRNAVGFLQLTISATFFNFCFSLVGTFLVIFATVELHGSALTFALLLALETGGTGIGALLVGRTDAVRRAGIAWTVGAGAASGGAAVVLALFPAVPVAAVALFVIGLASGYGGTAWLTAAQLLVPTEMQGRYFGVDNLGSVAIIPAAQVGGSFLIEAYGVRATFLAAGVVWLLAGLAFLLPRALFTLGYPPAEQDAPTPRTAAAEAGTPGSRAGNRPS